jgi:hypothetical protein
MNENVDYKLDKPKKGTKFLWWCAGADSKILEYSSYSDLVKYVGIGGVVLATGFMAALSMGFAMHTIFDSFYVTIPVAIVWALIVFNLDRFIVSSTGKGDGESSISRSELLNALPRLIMAILLGLTISAPLETKIFGKEIEREWVSTKNQLSQQRMNEVKNAIETTGEVRKTKEKEKTITAELANYEVISEKYNKDINDLVTGRNGVKPCNGGPNCPNQAHRVLYKQAEIALANVEKTKTDLVSIRLQVKVFEASQDSLIKLESGKILTDTAGFLDQIMMIEKLSSQNKVIPKYDPVTSVPIKDSEKEVYGSAFWPIWLVRLLFMIIEIAPVILKLMLIKGPYDYMTENVNQILETKQGISLQYLPDEHSQIHKLKRNHNPERIIAIIDHQNTKEAENAKEAITAFANKEKEEIAKNPGGFVKP